MAFTTPTVPTDVDGLQQDAALVGGLIAPNPCVQANRELCFAGQTANTSGASVANQAVGTFSIPNGTAAGTKITVPNTLIGANSLVFTQLTGIGGTITELTVSPADYVAGASFKVGVQASGNTTSAVDVWYWIVN